MDIAAELEQFIVSDLSGDEQGTLSHDDDLMSRGIVDSLGILRLMAFIEEKFAVSVGADEIVPENFRDISSLARFIEHKRQQG